MIDWQKLRYWIFDLDGTLTRPIFDFQQIKKELGLPQDHGILEAMSGLTHPEYTRISRALDDLEWDMAGRAESAEGAYPLLDVLTRKKAVLGIVTRNKKSHAIRTLTVAGLHGFFRPENIIGREEAPPKPDPAGIRLLLRSWNANPSQTVMVGDFRFDLEAGRAAEVATVYVHRSAAFPELADFSVPCLNILTDLL